MKLTLFDLDHTLLEGDSDVLWCDFLMRRGLLDRAHFASRNEAMERDYRAGTVSTMAFSAFYVATLAGRIGNGRMRGLKLGLALGLLPCGLVYAALAAASASGALLGGLGMLAFGLGTVPALVVVGLLGHAAARHWQTAANRAAPWVLAGNGLLLLALAWRALAA